MMKRIIVVFLVLVLFLTGCTSNDLSKEKETYLTYIKKLNSINKSTKEVPFNIEVRFDKITDDEIRYQVVIDEIKEDILKLKDNVENSSIVEIINSIIEILDFIIENSVQLEEQMTPTLKSGIEYCASPNENIDGDLIVQQLEIMKQLLELNFKKDTRLRLYAATFVS